MTKFDPMGSRFTNKFSTAELSEISESEERDSLTGTILSAAIEIHRALGPGLLESAYVTDLLTSRRSGGFHNDTKMR